mgnify:CR=1 FL=1
MKAIKTLAASSAVAMMFSAGNVAAQNLRLAHFMPAGSWQHSIMFDGWAKSIEEDSDGTLSFRVFPAQTLGSAVEGYDNARRGIADITWTVQGYTANRFPLSQIVELPGLFDTAEIGSCGFQKLYESGVLDDEYSETQVLYVHVHGPGHLFTSDKAVTSLSDMRGLQIRQPTSVIGGLLRELGAEPVGMPAPEVYEATQRGVIDGFLLPWEAVVGFRADEVVNHYTDVGLYSLAFVKTMNQSAYDRLSDAQRSALQQHSGMAGALAAGRGYDAADEAAKEKMLESGTLHILTDEERAQWEAAAERVADAYLDELESRGLPAKAVYDAFVGYVDECRLMLDSGDI